MNNYQKSQGKAYSVLRTQQCQLQKENKRHETRLLRINAEYNRKIDALNGGLK